MKSEKKRSPRSEFAPYVLVIAMGLTIAVLLDRHNNAVFLATNRLAVIDSGNDIRAGVEREIVAKSLLTAGLTATLASNPNLANKELSEIGARLVESNPGIIVIATAPNLIIQHVYPEVGNQAAIGLDFNARPDLLGPIRLAIESRATSFGSPFDLVQGGRGFVTRSPVFIPDEFSGGERLWGILSFVFEESQFLENAGLNKASKDFSVAFADEYGDVFFGSPEVFDQSPVLLSVALPLTTWTLAIAPKAGWPSNSPSRPGLWIATALVIIGVMALIYMFQRISGLRHKAEDQLNNAIEAIDDGFALYGPDDRLVMCNRKYKEIYARTAKFLVPGTPFADIIRKGVENGQYPEAVRDPEKFIQRRVQAHKNPGSEIEQEMPDGRWLKVAERKTGDGSTVGFRVDITDLKHALMAAEQANKTKSDFLNTVSHELRTPLTIVLGYNAFIGAPKELPTYKRLEQAVANADGDDGAALNLLNGFTNDVAGYSKKIKSSGQHLLGLIASLLDLAAIEQGNIQLDRKDLDVEDLARDIVSIFEGEADKKGLEIILEVEPGLILADQLRLRQALMYLVGNAIKFTDQGHIKIEIISKEDKVVFRISDTGCGIQTDNFDRVFERFNQIDSSATRTHGGIGLGLAISKYLIELHGGTIEIDSEVGVGSVFTFTLPRGTESQKAAA